MPGAMLSIQTVVDDGPRDRANQRAHARENAQTKTDEHKQTYVTPTAHIQTLPHETLQSFFTSSLRLLIAHKVSSCVSPV